MDKLYLEVPAQVRYHGKQLSLKQNINLKIKKYNFIFINFCVIILSQGVDGDESMD